MIRTRKTTLDRWLLSLAWILSICGTCAADEPKLFSAGAVAIDITPADLPVETAGSMTPHQTDKIHDRLFARCLVLDNSETRLALVVCDSCMLPRDLIDAAKSAAAAATGIPVANILCSATHTHSAVCVTPAFQSQPNLEYKQWLSQRIAEGIVQATKNLQPARIGWAVGHNPRQVFNRRWFLRPGAVIDDPFDAGTDLVRMNPAPNHPSLLKPAGPTDPSVPILAIKSRETGRPLAVWANYSLHYVGGIPEGGLSGDYYGQFAVELARRLSGDGGAADAMVAAMTNGTSGDINNINFFEGAPGRQPFEQITAVAADLAATVEATYARMEFVDWVPLASATEEVELNVRRPNAEELSRAQAMLAQAGAGPHRDRKLIYANETVAMADYPPQVPVLLQALRIGDVGIAASPCETFVETGLEIKEASAMPLTFVIELANGYNGYLPTAAQHALGGYETWRARSSYLAVDAEYKVRQTLLKLLDQVAAVEPKQVRLKPSSEAAVNDTEDARKKKRLTPTQLR